MGRARDISKVFSTSTSLSTDSEVSGSYLTLASASTTYQTKANSGLTLLNTTSFSAASSINLAANTFSSSYTNYRLIINQSLASTNNSLKLRLRSGSTDDSGGNYAYSGIYTRSDSATIASYRDAIGQTSFALGDYNSGRPTIFDVDIYNPQVATQTTTRVNCSNPDTSNTLFHFLNMGYHNQATSYDAASIITLSGTITGSYSIYGYNK